MDAPLNPLSDSDKQSRHLSGSKCLRNAFWTLLNVAMSAALLVITTLCYLRVNDANNSLSALLSNIPSTDSSALPSVRCDVAIVGGGVGGLWSGMRLKTAADSPFYQKGNVCVFDMQSEIGGRLKSRSFTFGDGGNISMDLGGMQFEYVHRIVTAQVRKYGLQYEERKLDPQNFNYLRNRRMNADDWALRSPYFFSSSELQQLAALGSSATPLIFLSNVLVAAGINLFQVANWSSCDWAQYTENAIFPPYNLSVYETGWWMALSYSMSGEAVAALRDVSGYDTFVTQYNFADLVVKLVKSFLTPVNQTVDHIFIEGYQQLPRNLANDFVQAGGSLYLNQQLVNAAPAANSRVQLTFQTSLIDKGNAAADNRKFVVDAGSVIFALPKHALQVLGPSLGYSDSVLNSVGAIGAFKMFLHFDEVWWLQYGFDDGEMVLTMPARKLYYWGYSDNGQHAVVLATYTDDPSAAYWTNMLKQYDVLQPIYFDGQTHPEPGAVNVEYTSNDGRAAIVRDLMRQIRIAHNATAAQIPNPSAAIFMDWMREPYGGGTHSWNVGVKSREIRQLLRQPSALGRAFVCGESYSDVHGWVEGALRSCEKLLIDQFQLQSQYADDLACY